MPVSTPWKICRRLLYLFLLLMAVIVVDPEYIASTWHVPVPHPGECWHMRSDGDPFTPPILVYVAKLSDGWISYTHGRGGLERSTKLWIFRSNYRPGCADTP